MMGHPTAKRRVSIRWNLHGDDVPVQEFIALLARPEGDTGRRSCK